MRRALALLALAAPSLAVAPAVTVSTLAGGAGSGCHRGGRAGYQDGDTRTAALFNRPSRVQAVAMPGGEGERLFVLDDENGCVRSMPLQQQPNGTLLVRSDTPCAAASPIGHNGSDVVFPNGTSRGWKWADGPQDFFITPGGAKLYLLNTDNNKLEVATGLPGGGFGAFTTLAGSGAIGSQDGAAGEATFTQPHGLSVAPSTGFAYVGDTYASCIRAVELATGRVATVAGTCGGPDRGGHADAPRGVPCSRAAFNHPHKVTVDPRNESIVYVSDVECSDDAGMSMPRGRCVPTTSSPMMTASFTGIRKLEMHPNGSCASVTTVAGFFNASAPAASALGFEDGPAATAKFHYIHGTAIRPLGAGERRGSGSTVLYAIDDFNQRVRQVDLATGEVTTLAGKGGEGCADGPGESATFNPVGLGVGRDGSVYVADYGNNRIRKVAVGGGDND
jgi:DNA-binding beta-propeller fold protein YncE